MSRVLLIIVCGTRITLLEHHHRIIEEILTHDPCHIRTIKASIQQHPRIDAGYIFIDCNSQTIVNAQIAFPFTGLKGYSTIHAL